MRVMEFRLFPDADPGMEDEEKVCLTDREVIFDYDDLWVVPFNAYSSEPFLNFRVNARGHIIKLGGFFGFALPKNKKNYNYILVDRARVVLLNYV